MQLFEALKAFIEVAEQTSFVKAAKKLNMPTSKVSKLVQWLEQQLKVILFARTTRRVNLTEDGVNLLQRAELLLTEWNDLKQSILDKNQLPQGKITIAAPANLLNINPILKWIINFLNQYPGIQLSTQLITQPISLSQQNIDILIGVDRYVLDKDTTLVKRILSFKYGLYASPTYLRRHAKIMKPADLKQHNCLLFRDEPVWNFSDGAQYVQGNYSADTGAGLFAAALEHVGLIKAPDFMAQEWVAKKQLKPILQKWYGASDHLNIYYQKLSYQPRKIKEFIEHILKCAKE